ncbi:MAG TPA: lytic transglycosylase domain-containing protein [Aquabacterium sp.]|uniref:lytic transglycosylase domain-containing protein n=1 Tax=Aquabacterium sp. TaxID=1872578 RepID=UPI002E3089C4|nr:lytic transglycosylase domain-containing protein [Aquabacterium sp.]HEX5371099.1 lytic transglycosylase domain-containing protein [Aquabacterium sp.]
MTLGMRSSTSPSRQRRPWQAVVALWGALALGGGQAWAGAQVEEPLANAVRTALSAAVGNAAPPAPVFADAAQKMAYERWVAATETRLIKRKPDDLVRREFLQTVWYEAKRAGLDPTLVLGLIEVESGFRKHAISSAGARGYMQVMPFWTRTIGDGDASRLFHMQTNLRFGCVILRHYLDREKGNMFLALGRYNGSRGRAEYPNLVFGAERRWQALIQRETQVAGLTPAQAQTRAR